MTIERQYIKKFLNEAPDSKSFQEILDFYQKEVANRKEQKSNKPISVEINHMERLLLELSPNFTEQETYSITLDDLKKIPTGGIIIRDGHEKFYNVYMNNGNGYFSSYLLYKGSLGELVQQSGLEPGSLPKDKYLMKLPDEATNGVFKFFIPDVRKL